MGNYDWHDADWQEQRTQHPVYNQPIIIYEVHLGSWRRSSTGQVLSYRQLANGDFTHTSGLLLLDRDGRIVARTEHVGSVADPAFVRAVRHALLP
jgi:hypothetical protein